VTRALPYLLVLAACGNHLADTPPDTELASPDAESADADAGAADAGAADAGAADALPDLPLPVVIERVTLAGLGDVEVRQGSRAVLVVAGNGLDRVSRVSLPAPVIAVVAARSDVELRVDIEVPHGAPPGDAALTLLTPRGAVAHPAAITVTPWVFAPDGTSGGRGTYSSPLRACWDEKTGGRTRSGDIMHLTAGIYRCNQWMVVLPGVTLRGDGPGRTILQGQYAGINAVGVGPRGVATVRDLTFTGVETRAVIEVDATDLNLDNVEIREVSSIGVSIMDVSAVTLSRFAYRASPDSTGVLVAHREATVLIADSIFDETDRGVMAFAGTVDIRDTTIRNSDVAVEVGDSDWYAATVSVRGGELHADSAIVAEQGDVTVEGTTLARWRDSDDGRGVQLGAGTLHMTGATVAGWRTGVWLGDSATSRQQTTAARFDGVTIHATTAGIVSGYWGDASGLVMRRSRVSTPGTAIDLHGDPTVVDLGTPDDPGNNELSGDGYALSDGRSDAGPPLLLHGTRLNGRRYEGAIHGPADVAPDYRVRATNTIQF
jgi:hypothetical protein